MTKWQLLVAFAERKPIVIKGCKFLFINSIQHEDGSGHRFNVTGVKDNGLEDTLFIETID